jgi:hypothetical protein
MPTQALPSQFPSGPHTHLRSHPLPSYANVLAQDPSRGPTPKVQVRPPTPLSQMCQNYPCSDDKCLGPLSHYQQTIEEKRRVVIDLTSEEEEMLKRRSLTPRPNASSGVDSTKMSTPPLDQMKEPRPKNTSGSSSRTSTFRMKKMRKGGRMTSSTNSSGPLKLPMLTQGHPQAKRLMYRVKSLRRYVEIPPALMLQEEVLPPLLQIITLITATRDLISTRTAWVPWDSVMMEDVGRLITHSGMMDGPLSP